MAWIGRPTVRTYGGMVPSQVIGLLTLVMAWCAEGLPVAFIPEQALVTTVRADMVDHGSGDVETLSFANSADWISAQEDFSADFPSAGITAFACG